MDLERKTIGFELKEVDEDEGTFEGYCATFTKHPDSYGDIIKPGAFKKTLKEMAKRIKILWHHNPWEPIGIPLSLTEDAKGLLVKGKLSLGVQRAREVLALMKDGVVTEMSIGYVSVKESWDGDVRLLEEIKLYDVSPVSFAANPEAVVLGAKAEGKPLPNEHACRLRDPGDFEDGTFRRVTRVSGGRKYSIIMGKLEGDDTMTEQAYRYDKEIWDEDDAETHCGDHDGSFEAASDAEKTEKSGRVLSAASLTKLQAAIDALQALLDSTEAEAEPDKSTPLDEEVAEEAAKLEATIAELRAENDGFDVQAAEQRLNVILDQIGGKDKKGEGSQ